MPRIPDVILNSTIYLYGSVEDAKEGAQFGGSGFLTTVPFETQIGDAYRTHLYAVTNSHVIREGASPIIRVTSVDGETKIIEKTTYDWVDDFYSDDVAVCSLGFLGYGVVGLLRETYMTPEKIKELNIGVGSDIVTVGRFISHDGKQRNLPVVRFGHISMMNDEPIENGERGTLQESFLVECQSNSGYSGSPVFVTDTHFGDPNKRGGLLGIVWGHLHITERVRDKDKNKLSDGWLVQANSGMMMVIPIWKLVDLLNSKELASKRHNWEKEVAEIVQRSQGGATLDVAMREEEEDITSEEFEKILRRVSQ